VGVETTISLTASKFAAFPPLWSLSQPDAKNIHKHAHIIFFIFLVDLNPVS
jgi:hypothetical protein